MPSLLQVGVAVPGTDTLSVLVAQETILAEALVNAGCLAWFVPGLTVIARALATGTTALEDFVFTALLGLLGCG